MFKKSIIILTALICQLTFVQLAHADRSTEEKIMLEHIDWITNNNSLYEYNGEPLPEIIYGTQEQLTAYFYGLDTYLEEGEDLIPVEGIFQSEGKGTIFLLNDFDWNNTADLDTLVHELVHYLQYINDITYDCSVAAELDAYRQQTEWMIENPANDIQPSYLMAIWIMETCVAEALAREEATED